MSEEVSQLFEVLQSLVRDHHAGAIPPIQGSGAVWGSLVAGAVGFVLADPPRLRGCGSPSGPPAPLHTCTAWPPPP
eukprot:1194050-Prorocentrum_minimum.AAC.1